MVSLLTEDEKAEIQQELQNVRDTFSRDIYVFVKEATKTPQSVSSDYNPLYGRAKTSSSHVSSGETTKKYTFKATIRYGDGQVESLVDRKGQFNLSASEGIVTIKVSESARNKILIASRVEIDDVLYIMDGDPKKVGPFSTQAYQIRMKREN